jgi:hypothetical protein
MKYVAPLFLLIVFAAFCWNNLGTWVTNAVNDPLQLGALGLIAAVIVLLVYCTSVGEKRWRAQGLDIDGQED